MTVLVNPLGSVLRDVLSSVPAWAEALSAYSVNNLEPELVVDAVGVLNNGEEFYRANGSTTTYSALFGTNFDRSGMATMVDSSGNLKWSAHNLIANSATQTGWTDVGTGVSSASATEAPDGTTGTVMRIVASATNDGAQKGFTTPAGDTYTGAAFVRSRDGSSHLIGVALSGNVSTDPVTAPADGSWVLVTGTVFLGAGAKTLNVISEDGAADFDTWGLHAYRSTLGGMVSVPADERAVADYTTYLPTTTAARYLLRRNAYAPISGVWTKKGFQLEEARTNAFTQSSFANAAWGLGSSNATKVANYASSPDGTTNATRLIDDNSTGTGVGQLTEGVTLTSATETIFSAIVKADQLGFAILKTAGFDAGANGTSWFNISAGTKGTINHDNSWIYALGDGWYWIAISITSTTDVAGFIAVGMAQSDGSENVDLDGTSSILVYQGQLEEGSFPTSLIPTTGATATRAADVTSAQIAAAKLPWSTTANWMSFDGLVTYADNGVAEEVVLLRRQQDASNNLEQEIATSSGRTGQPLAVQRESTSGTDSAAGSLTEYSPGINVSMKIASRHGTTYVNGAAEGTAFTESTVSPAGLADLSAVDLDIIPKGSGFLSLLRVGTGDPGDAGIESASS